MNSRPPNRRSLINVDDIIKAPKVPVSRRDLLKLGLLGATATTLAGIDALAWAPQRSALAATSFPDVQFDIGNFLAPVQTFSGIQVRFGPVYTVFLTAKLNRTPTHTDQTVLANALNSIEAAYPFSPSGIFTMISYGIPYFNKLPGGMTGSLVSSHMPRLLSNTSRYALEEAVPSPTDVTKGGSITKQTFNVPVVIEANDVLFSFRSDTLSNIQNVMTWLQGGTSTLGSSTVTPPAFSGLFAFTSMRTMFLQMSMPHFVAQQNKLPYTININPDSPMWMGFADQQVSGSGPATITTFQGNSSARFTNATSSSYFADGSIQHLSHVIQDLAQFYASDETYQERVQYMFRSDPIPNRGNSDQFTNGGGPAFLANDASVFLNYQLQGTNEAVQTAASPNVVNDDEVVGNAASKEPRMGHLSALQQSSRASDGTPIHIRMDGPGFDTMDVPGGSNQPKLQFSIFVPSAEFFRVMRVNQAALKYQQPAGPVDPDDNGLERFLTATRRQNFLIPSRGHRAFPLVELT